MNQPSKLLFICTGNYYRSRYAEALFNYEARRLNLDWVAFSRGLAIHLADGLGGELSNTTAQRLALRTISLNHCSPKRISLLENDLLEANRVIAMDRIEHHPMMFQQFPEWADRIDYWNSQDLQWEASEPSLTKIDQRVEQLIQELSLNATEVNTR